MTTAHGITFPFVSEDRILHSEWDEDPEELSRYLIELDEWLDGPDLDYGWWWGSYTRLDLKSSTEEEAWLRAEAADEEKIISRRQKDRRRLRKFSRECT